MARSEATLCVVQIDASAITYQALAPEGLGFRVEESVSRRFDGPIAPEALRAFAQSHDLASVPLYTVLPRHEVTVRILTLPARDPAEIASMVDLTAGEFAPYPRASLVVRHQVIASLPSGESRVLLALAHRDVIECHCTLLREAGLEPREIFLSTTCLHAAALALPELPAERFALVHLGPAALEMLVIDAGVVQFSRGVAHEGDWDLGAPSSRDALVYEVRDALAAYRRECEDGSGADTILVAVEQGDSQTLAALLESGTGKRCLAAPSFAVLATDGEPGGGASPLIGIGGALAASDRAPMSIGLLPASVLRERAMQGVQQRALRASALVAVVLVALSAWFVQAVIQRKLLIRELQSQIDALAPSAEGVAAKQRGLQIISRQLDGEGGFLELLSAVGKAAPPSDFNVTRIEYDRETGMNIWGRARTKDLVLSDFLGNLRAMGEGGLAMLARAHSQYETAGQERNESVYNYHVTIPALEEEGSDGLAATDR